MVAKAGLTEYSNKFTLAARRIALRNKIEVVENKSLTHEGFDGRFAVQTDPIYSGRTLNQQVSSNLGIYDKTLRS